MEPTKEPTGFSAVPDLHEYPEGSLPSPFTLMNPVRRLPPGLRLVAVGWLDGPMEFPTGATHPDVLSKLLRLGDEFLISEGTRGFHTCYYCQPDVVAATRGYGGTYRPQSPLSHRHHLVRLGDVVYMCPALLPHYVVAHEYRPPDLFQEAVLQGAFLADRDLVHTGEDFLIAALRQSLATAEKGGNVRRRTVRGLRRGAKSLGSRGEGPGPGNAFSHG